MTRGERRERMQRAVQRAFWKLKSKYPKLGLHLDPKHVKHMAETHNRPCSCNLCAYPNKPVIVRSELNRISIQ